MQTQRGSALMLAWEILLQSDLMFSSRTLLAWPLLAQRLNSTVKDFHFLQELDPVRSEKILLMVNSSGSVCLRLSWVDDLWVQLRAPYQ